MYRTITFNLQPTVQQRQKLEHLLRCTRQVYNAALEERMGAWKWNKRSVSKFDQFGELTESGIEGLEYGLRPFHGALTRLDGAFAGFFRRVKSGQTPGFPRFRSAGSWDSIVYPQARNWKPRSQRRLYLQGIGCVRTSRQLVGELDYKTLTIRRSGRRWVATVQHKIPPLPAKVAPKTVAAIDVGVVNLATLSWVDTETGESGTKVFENPRPAKAMADKLADAQRELSRTKRGSRRGARQRQRVARLHRKVANQRKNAAHHASKEIAAYAYVGTEDLSIAQMTKALPGKTNLNGSILDSGWGMLFSFIDYKAASAGGQMIKVNPRHTSQRCGECGHTAKENRRSQADFCCVACGYNANADINASKNILALTLSAIYADSGGGAAGSASNVRTKGSYSGAGSALPLRSTKPRSKLRKTRGLS